MADESLLDTTKLENLLGGKTAVGGIDLSPFITTAEVILSEEFTGCGHSEKRLEQIGLFLAAHFATLILERGGLTRYKVGESSEAYKEGSNADRGYTLTRFGQQAISLDTCGRLALNAVPMHKAEFRVVSRNSRNIKTGKS